MTLVFPVLVVYFAALYLMAAFVAADMWWLSDVMQWTAHARAVFLVVLVLTSGLAVSIIALLEYERKNDPS